MKRNEYSHETAMPSVEFLYGKKIINDFILVTQTLSTSVMGKFVHYVDTGFTCYLACECDGRFFWTSVLGKSHFISSFFF